VVPQRFAPVLAELAPLGDIFRTADRRLYVVGGTVRDLLLDRQMSEVDFDFTTNARPEETKRFLTGWADAVWTTGERFGTISAQKYGRTYEITTHLLRHTHLIRESRMLSFRMTSPQIYRAAISRSTQWLLR